MHTSTVYGSNGELQTQKTLASIPDMGCTGVAVVGTDLAVRPSWLELEYRVVYFETKEDFHLRLNGHLVFYYTEYCSVLPRYKICYLSWGLPFVLSSPYL